MPRKIKESYNRIGRYDIMREQIKEFDLKVRVDNLLDEAERFDLEKARISLLLNVKTGDDRYYDVWITAKRSDTYDFQKKKGIIERITKWWCKL